jgi:phage pi2 protein 07
MKKITVTTTTGTAVSFNGKHRPDLEKNNWHYYEDEYGDIWHFRKEHMVFVHEEDIE